MVVHPSSPIQTLQFEPTPKAIGGGLTALPEFRFLPTISVRAHIARQRDLSGHLR
ncbi:hypothetical protein R3P38DRAFT_3246883 [Favolaschia claudopus]|uniref:Uncharacterized protein n=1 Tax=Favolaschia claudopus TaxID=2862362 RepID=A0AAV9Z0D5_9AGAR